MRTLLIGNAHKTTDVKKEKVISAATGATYVIKRGKTNVTVAKSIEVTDILTMANKGLTKEEILAEFKIDDSEYKSAVSQLPEVKRKELHYLLVNNSKKKLIKTEVKTISNSKSRPKVQCQETQKVTSNVVNILDTSYLSCGECRFEKIKDAVILPKVFEQITVAYRNGSKRMCKLFHLLLEDKVDITLVGKEITVTYCPKDEDYADMEILAYALEIAKTGKIPVVYTADKALALYCKQKGIKYYFVVS